MSLLEFTPHPLVRGGHAQTLVRSFLKVKKEPPSVTKLVDLPDGDRLALELSTPVGWTSSKQTVVLVHGLCSSHEANHMKSLAFELWLLGVRVVRLNLRGCGSGVGLARGIYHSGRSEDVLAVLIALRVEHPRSLVSLVGFSLGGNVVLKLAAELDEVAVGWLEQVITVCAPLGLKACSVLLSRRSNYLYNWHFVRLLRADVRARHALFGLSEPVLPQELSLFAFDDVYTALHAGFESADDYYAKCSAAPLVHGVRVPAKVLFALDDPFIDGSVFEGVALPSHVEVFHTRFGGHVGFLGHPAAQGGVRWLDWRLLSWLGLA